MTTLQGKQRMSTMAIRSGIKRGWIEFCNSLRAPQDLAYYFVGAAVFTTVVALNRNNMIDGLDLSVATLMLPGILGMQIAIAAAYGLATALATEREDGTLLRAKSVPHGMVGYVSGQVFRCTCETIFGALLVLIPATFLIDGIWTGGPVAVLHVLGLFVLGLIATLPLGFIVGSVFKNPRSVGGWGLLVIGGVIWVSGIFSPVSEMAGWAQVIAQLTPVYWLGLGMRAAMLPDGVVVLELGQQWRVWETFGVLGLWAVVGLLLAPVLLRRMARKESGSGVEARRHSALQRI